MIKKTVMLAAGGTGGHAFPAQAVANLAAAQGLSPIMVLDKRGNSFLPPEMPGVKKIILNIRTANNGGLVWWAQMLTALLIMIYQIARHRPAAVLGFGGFPALPTVLAAWLWRVPIILSEQNRVLGRANRVLAPLAKKIALAFPDTQKLPARQASKAVVTGIPLRHNVLTATKSAKSKNCQIAIIGGSQGAAVFSQFVPQAINQLSPAEQKQLTIIHQARPEFLQTTKDAYAGSPAKITIASFFDNIGDILANSDLVICRAGASTVAEVSYIGTAAVFIPYTWATDNHQHYNASYLADKHAAILLPEKELTAANLAAILRDLLQHPQRFKDIAANAHDNTHTQAAQSLVDLLRGCF